MEEKWYNPISLLRPELQEVMQHITSQFPVERQQEILDAHIGILFDDRPLAIRTPIADLETNQIILQEVYLAFLWCCCYVTVAINTMLYEKLIEEDKDIIHFHDRVEFPQVLLTLNWARSLQKEVSWWPQEAARPDRQDKWTESANNLFQACVAYITFHEIGHVVMHQELRPLINTRRHNLFYDSSETDNLRIYNAEIEADQFAFDCLMGNSTLDDVILIKNLGASLAQLSNFYLLEIPDTRGGKTHPDLDDRLKEVLGQVTFREEANQFQFRMHVLAGLQLFLWLTETSFIPENQELVYFEEIEDLENYLFGLITKMKNVARGISQT